MPIVSPGTTQPPSTQADVGGMIGEIQLWRPDCGPQICLSFLNNALRKVVDHRLWYGLMARGEISSPAIYSTGTVTTTFGSVDVVGVGTAWTSAMVGRQFRIGMVMAVYTIKTVTDATHLTLDLPWGEPSQSGIGYQILQSIYSFGPKVKRILTAVNKRQNWKINLDLSQKALDTMDPQRARMGFTWAIVPYMPNSDGEPQWELYPWPTVQQAFPFIGYNQPSDFSDDSQSPPAFLRSDILVLGALSDALAFRRGSQYYDPDMAAKKERQFKQELLKMELADDNLAMKDLQFEIEHLATFPLGDPQAGTIPPGYNDGW